MNKIGQLNQFDNFDDLSEDRETTDSSLLATDIGEFIISFSHLEHSINLDLAEQINSRGHEPGYRIISVISIKDKISLLSDFYLKLLNTTGQEVKIEELKSISSLLKEINTFRNKVAHANWGTYSSEDSMVRTKIVSNDTGDISFRYVEMSKDIIQKHIDTVYEVQDRLSEFFIDVMNTAITHKN